MTRRILLVIVINVITVLLLLLGIEWGIRIIYPELKPVGTSATLIEDGAYGASKGLRPNAVGESNGVVFRVDDKGMLSYADAYDATKKSILFLGDSVTMGIGVDPDSTFVGRISQVLDTLNVLNPSLIGYNVQDYQRVLNTWVADDDRRMKYGIERVLLFWCLNDVYSDNILIKEPGSTLRSIGGQVLPWVRRNAMSYQWLKAMVTDRPAAYYQHDAAFYHEENEALIASLDLLTAMQALCEEKNVKLEVILLPYAYQLRDKAHAVEAKPQELMRRLLHVRNVAVADVLPYLSESNEVDPESIYLWGDGIHFASSGHKEMAHWLGEFLSM